MANWEQSADTLEGLFTMTVVRPVTPIELPSNFVKAEIGPRPQLASIDPALLSIDEAYQRDLSRRSIRLIHNLVRCWDWRRYKIPVVARVGDEWHVIDGQHTAIAALTHGGIGEIDVMVVDATEETDRARAFIGHNRDRVPITNTQLFFAAAAAGDEDAVTAQQVCARAGATILRNPSPGRAFRPGELIAVAALVQLVRRRSALKARAVIETLVRAKVAPISSEYINAVDTVLYGDNFGDVQPDAVVAALERFGPTIAAKAVELALAKRLRKARAFAVILYQHTKKRKVNRDAEPTSVQAVAYDRASAE